METPEACTLEPPALHSTLQRADAAHAAVLQAVREVVARVAAEASGLAAEPLFIMAVSGGLDSMVLAHALHATTRGASSSDTARTVRLSIAHLDHQLRPESGVEAAFVVASAREWGLPVHVAKWERDAAGGSATGSLEADARLARYAFLGATARKALAASTGQSVYILTAHHADDQAETLLLNLLRGSGVQGLAAMRADAPLPGDPAIRLLRPFLGVTRDTLRRYAEAVGLQWCEDASNSDTQRTRNWIRHVLLPELEARFAGVSERLALTSALMADAAERLDGLTETQLAHVLIEQSPGERIRLDAGRLSAQQAADQRSVLRRAWLQTFPDQGPPGHSELAGLAHALDDPAGLHAHGPHPLRQGLCWTLLAGEAGAAPQLSLHQEDALPVLPPGAWLDSTWRKTVGRALVGDEAILDLGALRLESQKLPVGAWGGGQSVSDPWEAWLDHAAGPFYLTTPAAGDRIAPLGMGGRTRAVGDLFTDRKIAPPLRTGWPLVVDRSGKIVWVCGIAVALHAAISEQTRQVLRLRWLPALGQ